MDDPILEELRILMESSVHNIKATIGDDPQNQTYLVAVLCKFLQGIISTVVDLAEESSPGAKQQIYADIEAGSRKGCFKSIEELGTQYSVSDIESNDLPNAMNYLGKAMSTALFKGLYELPKSLQSRELLLRAIEALLANLLNQKFNAPDNPHEILDSFCEHVHMALDDLQESPENYQNNREKTTYPENITSIVMGINKRANDILSNGGGDEDLLLSLSDVMGEIKKVMDVSTKQEMDEYCEEYEGFYRYMDLLNQLAIGIADGTISVP